MGCLLLLCVFSGKIAAQSLSGQVYTIEVSGDTSMVYMARIQWKGTSVGTFSDANGFYRLPFANTDTLIVKYSFYNTDTLIIPKGERHHDIFINTAQSLQEVVVSKKRQKYVRKGNPAIELVKQVIAHKDDDRIESTEKYKSNSYKKLVLSLVDLT